MFLIGLLTLLPCGAFSGENTSAGRAPITTGRFAVQLVSGPLFSPVLEDDIEDLNYVQTDLRFSWSLNRAATTENPRLAGYFDLVLELTHSVIFEGPGSYLSGITALLRYNFKKRHESLAPYVQLGAGIVYNNAYKDTSQTLIGQAIEFTPQAGIGLHYFLSERWSVDAEVLLHHISNANMADRNMGVNAVGALVGLSFFF